MLRQVTYYLVAHCSTYF